MQAHHRNVSLNIAGGGRRPSTILCDWRAVGCKNMKSVGVELIAGEMFLRNIQKKLKMGITLLGGGEERKVLKISHQKTDV